MTQLSPYKISGISLLDDSYNELFIDNLYELLVLQSDVSKLQWFDPESKSESDSKPESEELPSLIASRGLRSLLGADDLSNFHDKSQRWLKDEWVSLIDQMLLLLNPNEFQGMLPIQNKQQYGGLRLSSLNLLGANARNYSQNNALQASQSTRAHDSNTMDFDVQQFLKRFLWSGVIGSIIVGFIGGFIGMINNDFSGGLILGGLIGFFLGLLVIAILV